MIRFRIDLVSDVRDQVRAFQDPDGSAPIVDLGPAGVQRRSDLVSIDYDWYRVGPPTDWPAKRPVGGLPWYLLPPA